MPRRLVLDPRLPALLTEQDGLLSMSQALVHGLTKAAVRHQVDVGHWQRLLPSVVLTRSGEATRRQRLIAASLWAGPLAAVDGVCSCWWHGIRAHGFDPECVCLVLPDISGLRSHGFVRVRLSRWRTPTVASGGVTRYAELPTALVAAACQLPQRPASGLLHEAVQTRRVHIADLEAAMALAPPRGSAKLWDILGDLGAGTRSLPEADMRTLTRASSVLPEPLYNHWLALPGGRLVSPDGLLAEAALVSEVNGRRFHAWGEDFDDMQKRHDAMTVAGLVVLHYSPLRIRREPRDVLRELEACYLMHRGRGLPPGVQLIPAPERAPVRL